MEPLRLKSVLLAGLGALGYTKEKLQGLVEGMVEKGELTREQGEKVIGGWVERGKEEQAGLSTRISEELQKLVTKLHLVTREDLERLTARVAELEKRAGVAPGNGKAGAPGPR
jgi:polyhydroxyalkanoate synthesis regulator phasin